MNTQTTHPKQASITRNQSGIASFLVTLVLMIVITLIVIGFAQIARRDQRETLDEQLSSQAFYAAETGVNLVQNLLKTTPATGLTKSKCLSTDPGVPAVYVNAQLSDTATEVSNTCLLVNAAPSTLVYDDVGINSTIVPLQPDGSYGNSTMTITWQPTSKVSATIASCPTNGTINSFTPSGSWPATCPYGVLRFDLVDLGAPGTPLDEATLSNNTMTIFAPPTTSQLPIIKREGTANVANPQQIQCSSGLNSSCSLNINNVNFSDTYYMRVTSLYNDTSITGISAISNTGSTIHFIGAQLAVDSTGKAVDVLRRISVRLDQHNQLAPSYAIQGTSGICKQGSSVGPGTYTVGCP